MLERDKCPHCSEEILKSAKNCKNCWLPRGKFGTYEELKKQIKEAPEDYVLLGELCKIYQQLRKEKHRSRKKENIEEFPAYYDESIDLNKKLFKEKKAKSFKETTEFLTEYYRKKGKYTKEMLPVLWEYIDLKFGQVFHDKEQAWDILFLEFSNVGEYLEDLISEFIEEKSQSKKEALQTVINTIICILKDNPDKKFSDFYSILSSSQVLPQFDNAFDIDEDSEKSDSKKSKIDKHNEDIKQKIKSEIKDFEYLTEFNEDRAYIDFLHLPLKRKQKIPQNRIDIAIAASANTGKSSLINLLMKNDLAEVKNFPGVWEHNEQRDNKYPTEIGITFIDTPGSGSIKQSGGKHKEIAMNNIKESDFAYAVFDIKAGFKKGDYKGDENDLEIYKQIKENNKNTYFLFNKIDLCTEKEKNEALTHIESEINEVYPISAVTGEGVGELIKRTIQKIENDDYCNALIFYLNKHLHRTRLINKLNKIVVAQTVVSIIEEPEIRKDEIFVYNHIFFILAVIYDCLKFVVIPNKIKKDIFLKYSDDITQKIGRNGFDNYDFLCFGLASGFTIVKEYLPYIENNYDNLSEERIKKLLGELGNKIENNCTRYKNLLQNTKDRIIKNIEQNKPADLIMTLLLYFKIN